MDEIDRALNRDLDLMAAEVGEIADRLERVRELRARRGRDLSPATRAQAERISLQCGRALAILLSVYAQGEG